MLERDSRADVQSEILILLHVRLESRRHNRHLAARQYAVLCRREIVARARRRLSLRQGKPRRFIRLDDFKSTLSQSISS